jgi:hypothetical protein
MLVATGLVSLSFPNCMAEMLFLEPASEADEVSLAHG